MRYSKLVLLLIPLFIVALVSCKKNVQSDDNITINGESIKFEAENSAQGFELIGYAIDGNLEGVKKLINSGVNINIGITDKDYNRRTPLKAASENGHLPIVKYPNKKRCRY